MGKYEVCDYSTIYVPDETYDDISNLDSRESRARMAPSSIRHKVHANNCPHDPNWLGDVWLDMLVVSDFAFHPMSYPSGYATLSDDPDFASTTSWTSFLPLQL